MSRISKPSRFSGGNFAYKKRSSSVSKNKPIKRGIRKPLARKMRGERIDVSRFIRKISVTKIIEEPKAEHVFADFNLCPQLQKNLQARKYLIPTPIQDQTIEHTLNGKDLIGLANTGTGKTAAFLLPMINKCFHDYKQNVLIVAPTRELAVQIDEEFRKFTGGLKLYSAVCVGGLPIYKQIAELKRFPNFVIGTPGRLKDLKERGVLNFSVFQNVVLDEIDRMLDMGFIDEIKAMLADMPQTRQSLFFSATLPPKIKELSQQFLKDPLTVKVSHNETADNIDQDIVRVSKLAKFDKLKVLLTTKDLKKVLIFSETKRDVERLTENLSREGFKADSIHGDKKQSQRQRALYNFKEDRVQILVATDVAARGLDIKDVTHVINYTIPQTYDDYIHRIGRTGRENKKGFALTFIEAN